MSDNELENVEFVDTSDLDSEIARLLRIYRRKAKAEDRRKILDTLKALTKELSERLGEPVAEQDAKEVGKISPGR